MERGLGTPDREAGRQGKITSKLNSKAAGCLVRGLSVLSPSRSPSSPSANHGAEAHLDSPATPRIEWALGVLAWPREPAAGPEVPQKQRVVCV